MSRIAKAAAITAAAGAVLAGGAGVAAADAGAAGAAVGSPGVLSGNLLQVPVHVPINLCGNTIDIIGLLNPAFGNQCENSSTGFGGAGGGDNGAQY
ncbi:MULTISPECIES: chaplin [unclassified Streptomyces]|uniref:chaplin n=1 Tax=unclassified Streptomyces TaxID=2593676 RepID=UPI002E2849CD|nr:chaplin [Streptomyces sp. NBC_00223]